MILTCDSLTSVHFRFPGGRKALTAAKRDCRKPGSRFTSLATMLPQRYWNKVQKTETCWNWTGCPITNGYGQSYLNGRLTLAHRAMWAECFGPVPDGLLVLHKCDNRACVNPDHLWIGTMKDNAIDCARKGRSPWKKLNKEQAMEIYNSVEPRKQISRHYGVSESCVDGIKKRRGWAWMHDK